MNTTTRSATPAKLRNGNWGARVQGAVAKGDVVTITTKAGKTWTATVDAVVWTDGQVSLVATSSSSDRPSARQGRYAGYQRRIDRAGDASTCNCRMCQSGSECMCERDWS
jgi:hypothetical protein